MNKNSITKTRLSDYDQIKYKYVVNLYNRFTGGLHDVKTLRDLKDTLKEKGYYDANILKKDVLNSDEKKATENPNKWLIRTKTPYDRVMQRNESRIMNTNINPHGWIFNVFDPHVPFDNSFRWFFPRF